MSLSPQVDQLREQFPALAREVNGRRALYADGPAGTQVPQRVIDAIANYLSNYNANHGGLFATSRENDAMLDEAQRAVADFLGSDDPDCVTFGANMTTLTFTLSRSIARTWQAGDEIIVTRLDHDANVAPWVLAAEDVGVTVNYVDFNHEDCTLSPSEFRDKISDRTKLVAVGCASNASGSINSVSEICGIAKSVGAITFLDAVQYAPHVLIDVAAIGCDFLACSAYKFFGPHVGVLWGRRKLLEELPVYKLRPATDALPDRWVTGTLNHECIAGVIAAIEYLADLGREVAGNSSLHRREALKQAYAAINEYESGLTQRMLEGLGKLEEVTVRGITDPQHFDKRLPTVSFTHGRLTATEIAQRLGDQGIFVWHGNYYALSVTEQLGLEPEGMVRIGLVHYNTMEEADRLINAISQL